MIQVCKYKKDLPLCGLVISIKKKKKKKKKKKERKKKKELLIGHFKLSNCDSMFHHF